MNRFIRVQRKDLILCLLLSILIELLALCLQHSEEIITCSNNSSNCTADFCGHVQSFTLPKYICMGCRKCAQRPWRRNTGGWYFLQGPELTSKDFLSKNAFVLLPDAKPCQPGNNTTFLQALFFFCFNSNHTGF